MSVQIEKNGSQWTPEFHQILFVVLLFTTIFAAFRVHSHSKMVTLATHPIGVMGTSCTLSITVKNCDFQKGLLLLNEAEQKLRQCEQLTSTWLVASEISRINHAKKGETINISPFTMAFLRQAQEAYQATDGAFDITCGALWFLWQRCEREERLPTEAELATLKAETGWDNLEISDAADIQSDIQKGKFSVTKKNDSLALITGGIAKGMAIDAALRLLTETTKEDGCVLSAFVEVGGDIAVWHNEMPIEVENPNKTEENAVLKTIAIRDGGVCTSGHHARYFTIGNKQYSQILDPRSGQPVPKRWNITVTAPTATQADYWATALEVLGKEGISLLPEGMTAEFIEYHAN